MGELLFKKFNGLFKRILRELKIPQTKPGKILRPFSQKIYHFCSLLWTPLSFLKQRILLPETLCLFYDLETAPITFDLSWMLALAEKHRRDRGLKFLYVVFVPGASNGLREEMTDYEEILGYDTRQFRLQNLLFPLTKLVKACKGFSYCATRQQAELLRKRMSRHVFPPNYDTIFPLKYDLLSQVINEPSPKIMALTATQQALSYIKEWMSVRAPGKKIIVITLRQYKYMPKRNSNISAWATFAKSLDTEKYFVVIIPDTDSAMQGPLAELDQFTHFPEACWNIELRAALYETCYLSMGINNGPLALCWLNEKSRYIMFKIITDDVPQTNSKVLADRGFSLGKQPPFLAPYQRWVWEEDSELIIEHEFKNMCRIIDVAAKQE
jgi:hypothetical protein